LLMAEPHDDFHAQTALETIITFLRRYGCPERMSFDHDPRWLGSPSGRDFPSALQRMLLCLGIEPRICPPQRPDRNAFVERYHRSYKYECLRIFRPKTLEEVRAVTLSFEQHDNEERPHQGRACGNRPPRQAFPTLPSLPALPEAVQADRWLWSLHQRVFARTVGADGCVAVNHETYYLSKSLKGRRVALVLDAVEGAFAVSAGVDFLQWLPLKGIVRGDLGLEEFLALMVEEARSQERRRLAEMARRLRRDL
jgi:hypothetical protein